MEDLQRTKERKHKTKVVKRITVITNNSYNNNNKGIKQ